MEQAFRNAHGFGINEYQNDPGKIIEVEQRRDQDYSDSQKIVSQLERQVHRDI